MVNEPYRHKKHLGQHFLHDKNVIEHLLHVIHLSPQDEVVEIGPGQGVLTEALCPHVGRLDAIEYDRDLIPGLQEKFAAFSHFHLHHQDALKVDYHTLRRAEKLRIVGNLPYQISTPLLFHLLRYADDIQDMHFMLQKEVVLRMAAPANSAHYGRLSVMVQYFCKTEPLFFVSRRAFHPPPKVDSQIIRLTPYQNLPHFADNFILFRDIVRAAFSMRRKTLKNCLKSFNIVHLLEEMGLGHQRAETLSVEKFVCLANAIAAIKDKKP